MPNIIWRCENEEGDVKFAAREAHVEILEAKGYVCTLSPDMNFESIDLYSGEDN